LDWNLTSQTSQNLPFRETANLNPALEALMERRLERLEKIVVWEMPNLN
jgi:hypothetical protein